MVTPLEKPKKNKSIFDNFIDSVSDVVENVGEAVTDYAGKAALRNVKAFGEVGQAVGTGIGVAAEKAIGASTKLGYTSPVAGIKTTEAAVTATAAGLSPEEVNKYAKAVGAKAAASQEQANLGLGGGVFGTSLGITGKALEGAEAAWSYGVARPLATGALLADDRLYKKGTIEQDDEGTVETVKTREGFQWDDVTQAWNRSEDVSVGQASTYLIGKAITRYNVPVLSAAVEETNIAAYDPWSVSDMADAIENPYFNALSGGIDIGTQIFIPPALKVARLASVNKLGLRSNIKSGADLDEMRVEYSSYKEWKETGGQSGRETTVGLYVSEAAKETNPSKLRTSPIVANSNGVDKGNLAGILAKTTDEDTIANIYLANMGDEIAIKTLADAAPDHVWALADMNSMIVANNIDGVRFSPKGEELIRVNQIFDSAINRDQYFANLRDSFTTRIEDDVVLRGPGSTWMPSKSMLVEKVRIGKGKSVYALKNSDYTDTPQWVQRVADSKFGGPTSIFIQWAGSRKPLGYVTKSGARPDDWYVEFNAVSDSIPLLRGNREIIVPVVNEYGAVSYVTKNANVWRSEWNERLNIANSEGRLPQEWAAWENDSIIVMSRTLDIDPAVGSKFVEGYRTQMNAAFNDLQENGGYLFDEFGSKVILDAVSQRQLLNSFLTLPMSDIYSLLQKESSTWKKYAMGSSELLTSAFDAGMKLFRTDVLFRPGYTGKNSILEPLISSYLGHGTILSDEGVRATLGNFGLNRLNQTKRVAYLLDLDRSIFNRLKAEPKSSRRKLKNELRELVRQRYDAQDEISGLIIELDAMKAGKISPAMARINEPEVRGKLMDAHTRMDAIDSALDNSLPEWRQIVEPATISDVASRLKEYKAVLGLDDQYVKDLYDELGSIYAASYESAQIPTRQMKQELGRIDADIRTIDNALKNRSEEYNIPDTDVTDISVAEVGAQRAGGRPAREQVDPTVVHPNLPPSKNIGLINVSFIEKFLEDVKLTPDQRLEAADLGDTWKSARSANKPLVVQWDDVTNKVYIDPMGDGVVELAAMKAAGFDSIPVTVVTKKIPEGKGIDLPVGKWLTENSGTGGSRRSTPKNLNPDEIFPTQYGAIKGGRVVGTPTSPTRANDFDGDIARGRDLQGVALQLRRTSLVEQSDRLKERLKIAEETGIDAFTDFPLSVNAQARIDSITTSIAKIESSKNVDKDALLKQVDDLQKIYDDVVDKTTMELSNPNPRLDELQEKLESIDAALAKTQQNLGEKKAKLQSVSGLEGYRGSGRGTMTVVIGGEKVQVPAAFSNNAYDFGEGYRAEASASTSNRLLYDPSSRANYESGRWERSNRPLVIDRNDPLYFDELAHVSNRYFRGDPLIQRILEGESRGQVATWLMTKEGKAYQRKMGKPYLTTREPRVTGSGIPNVDAGTVGAPRKVILESTTELDEVYRIVNQYIPDEAVRKLVASKEVTGGELQSLLAARTDLGRIAGEDLQYIPSSTFAAAGAKVNTALDNIWQFIATMPEDRVARWPFYQREFKYQMQQRIDILESQGIKVSENQVSAMRQASHRASLTELEKTFYNIRRYNNPIYMSRFLMSFPGAFFNSLYRYGRFAIKEPERTIQTAVFANDILANMGVDKDGNKVDNAKDAEYLLIPGTKGNATDTGLRFPVSSFASMTIGLPSLSWPAIFTVSSVNANNPSTEDNIKNVLGDAVFQEVFPFGIPQDPKATILGSYQKDLIKLFQGESNEDFQQISVQTYSDMMANWEKNGGEGDAPSFNDAIAETSSFLRARSALKWTSPFAVDKQPPGQIMRDAWYDTIAMFPGDTQSAREYYIKMYGDWAQWYTYSSTQYTGYIPATIDSYERIWVDYPEVTREIVALGDRGPEYLSLFALGTDGTFSPSVSSYMKNNTFPGDTQNIASKMSVEQFDNMINVDRGWSNYTSSRVKYDTEVARLRILRDEATTEYNKDQYRQKIADEEAAWKGYISEYSSYNPAWAFEFNQPVGNKAKNATLVLETIVSDKKFASKEGKTDLWQGVQSFLDGRKKAIDELAAATDSDEKAIIKRNFSNWVTDSLLDFAPEFTGAWQRFYAKEWTID